MTRANVPGARRPSRSEASRASETLALSLCTLLAACMPPKHCIRAFVSGHTRATVSAAKHPRSPHCLHPALPARALHLGRQLAAQCLLGSAPCSTARRCAVLGHLQPGSPCFATPTPLPRLHASLQRMGMNVSQAAGVHTRRHGRRKRVSRHERMGASSLRACVCACLRAATASSLLRASGGLVGAGSGHARNRGGRTDHGRARNAAAPVRAWRARRHWRARC